MIEDEEEINNCALLPVWHDTTRIFHRLPYPPNLNLETSMNVIATGIGKTVITNPGDAAELYNLL